TPVSVPPASVITEVLRLHGCTPPSGPTSAALAAGSIGQQMHELPVQTSCGREKLLQVLVLSQSLACSQRWPADCVVHAVAPRPRTATTSSTPGSALRRFIARGATTRGTRIGSPR